MQRLKAFFLPPGAAEMRGMMEHARASVENAIAAVERAVPQHIVDSTELGALKRNREATK